MNYENETVVIGDGPMIYIDKNNPDPIIPDWIYTAEPGEVIRQLISDGTPHMIHEVRVILGNLCPENSELEKLVDYVGGRIFRMDQQIWITKKDLTLYEANLSTCIGKILDMYKNESKHSVSEIKNKIDRVMPKDTVTLIDILSRARLIFFLRNTQGCLRTTYLRDPKIDDSGERMSYGEDKAVREPSDGKGRFDLITPFGLERLAKWYELGAKKYTDRNWEKGIPFSRYFDSAMRHMMKFIMGRTDEDHLAAAVWNLMAIMHHQELVQTELDDLPHYIKEDCDA